MSAGRGVQHAEYNASPTKEVHFLQIWIHPDASGIDPGYEQKRFEEHDKRGKLALIASRDGAAGSVTVHQDVRVYAGLFDGAEHAEMSVAEGRKLYVHVARGSIEVGGTRLDAGDAILDDAPTALELRNGRDAEVLVFDLPSL
jgi:redox-sensitive bicupin YhaK (pirin superfamily)